jgi:hypothetical protein
VSIRIRRVEGITVALCAARSVEKTGDVYLDDDQHHALAEKFRRDFTDEGLWPLLPDTVNTNVAQREETEEPW